MRRLTVGAVLAVLAAGSAAALPPDQPNAAVQSLITQLGSENLRTREKAGRDLLALGDRALPALKAALKTLTDAEAQRRAREWIAASARKAA